MAIGQRTKLTPQLQKCICALIRDKGAYPEVAAVACGISHATFYEWMARGRVKSSNTPGDNGGSSIEPGTHGRGDPKGLYAAFADAIKKADADLEVDMVEDAKAKALTSKNPLASIIFLSRRMRERWSEQVNIGAAAGREAVVSMERIKEAWDTPEIVEGEYKVIEEGQPKLEAVNPEANGSQMSPSTNQSEATGFHVPPADYEGPDQDASIDDDDDESDATPDETSPPMPTSTAHARQSTNNDDRLPTFYEAPTSIPTPVEIVERKSEESKRDD